MRDPLPFIRAAQPSDVPLLTVLAVETYVAAFGHSFTPSDLAVHLEKHLSPTHIMQMIAEDMVLVAKVEDWLIGYVQFGAVKSPSQNPGDQEIRRLYVHSAFQNAGYGRALMEAALSHPSMSQTEDIYLDVWEHNPGARCFYQRFGFEVVGTRAFEVESGESDGIDLIMVRRQPGTAAHR